MKCEYINCMFWHWGVCTGDPELVSELVDYEECQYKNGKVYNHE